jgi:hypothetical protein
MSEEHDLSTFIPTEKNAFEISKNMRSRVLKRDSYSCRLCGKKAPDVTLDVIHIVPVSDGGRSIAKNLITLCEECKPCKKPTQIYELTQKDTQSVASLHIELEENKNLEVESVCNLFKVLTYNSLVLNSNGKRLVRKALERFTLNEVMEALREGVCQYSNPSRAIDKLCGICACRRDPKLKRRVFIVNSLVRKIPDLDRRNASIVLFRFYKKYGDAFYDYIEAAIDEAEYGVLLDEVIGQAENALLSEGEGE